MDKLKISKGGGTQLYGQAIPVNGAYGRIARNTYYAELRKNGRGWFVLHVWDEKRKNWKVVSSAEYMQIHVYLHKYVEKHGQQSWIVQNRTVKRREAFYDRKRQEFAVARAERDINRPYEEVAKQACPMKRLRTPIYRGNPRQLNAQEFYQSAPAAYSDKTGGYNKDAMYMSNPHPFHKEGLKHPFKDYRPEDNRPIISTKHIKDDNKYERMPMDKLEYLYRNSQNPLRPAVATEHQKMAREIVRRAEVK